MRPWLYPLLYAGLALLSGPVAAADGDIVRDLQEGFRDSAALWYAPLQQVATWLLLSLAVISYTWSASQMVLRNADLGEFVAEFVRLVIFTGFFLFLIQGGLVLLAGVIAPFMNTGAINEMTCAGSLLIVMIGTNLMGITKIKVADYLPAIVFAPVIYNIVSLFS